MTEKREKRGPKPETVKIEGDWEDAVKTALEKTRPIEGWPKSEEPSHNESDSERDKGD